MVIGLLRWVALGFKMLLISASTLTSGKTLTARLTEMNGIRKRNAPVSHKESTSEP